MATLSDSGQVRYRPQYHVCLPTYKDEYKMAGAIMSKRTPAQPLGAWWLVCGTTVRSLGRWAATFEQAL